MTEIGVGMSNPLAVGGRQAARLPVGPRGPPTVDAGAHRRRTSRGAISTPRFG